MFYSFIEKTKSPAFNSVITLFSTNIATCACVVGLGTLLKRQLHPLTKFLQLIEKELKHF